MEWATQIINQLATMHFSIALIVSFSIGLLTSFNPCMLGMASSILLLKKNQKIKASFPSLLPYDFIYGNVHDSRGC